MVTHLTHTPPQHISSSDSPHDQLGFPGGSDGKETTCSVRDLGSIPGSGGPLENGMVTHSSVFA